MFEDLYRERDDFLNQWCMSCDEFVISVYHNTIHTLTSQVAAIVKGEASSSVIDDGNLRPSGRSINLTTSTEVDEVRYSKKWKSSGITIETVNLKSIATAVPMLSESLTPLRGTKQSINTHPSEDLSWGDRARSFSPTNKTPIHEKTSYWNPVAESVSMIPKPPPINPRVPQGPVSEEEELPEAAAEDEDPVRVCNEVVEAAVPAAVKVDSVLRIENKPKIPALARAAMAKEKQERQEKERKERKMQLRMKWKKEQEKICSATKADAKPDVEHGGIKRPSELESSVNKRQKLELIQNRTKKTTIKVATKVHGLQTPEMTGPLPHQTKSPGKELSSPQYDLTPVGMLHTDYDKKLHRRNKHVPSWACSSALLQSMVQQTETMENVLEAGAGTLSPEKVFGKPDPMVMRNTETRAYQYEHRSNSSVEWSTKEDDSNTK
eukprot:g3915.t1